MKNSVQNVQTNEAVNYNFLIVIVNFIHSAIILNYRKKASKLEKILIHSLSTVFLAYN